MNRVSEVIHKQRHEGFRLAAADLEIRGAGEFLGKRQHGHIASLGFDLFCQRLERAVADLSGTPLVERPPATFQLEVDIKVPETYMPEGGDRLALYKRLSVARDGAEIDRLQADTEDRIGHLPPPGSNLFALSRLRLVAEAAGVKSVDVVDAKLQIRSRHGASRPCRRRPLDRARTGVHHAVGHARDARPGAGLGAHRAHRRQPKLCGIS